MENNKKLYQKSLNNQNKEFQKTFEENNYLNRQKLIAQRGTALRALIKQKQNLSRNFKDYTDKRNDPFYSILDLNSKLTETSRAYILRTNIPAYEKENIDVRVHNDKIVISGKRVFEDSIKDEDRKISTHSFQSIREEIPLNFPVMENSISKYEDNGVLTITIPKRF